MGEMKYTILSWFYTEIQATESSAWVIKNKALRIYRFIHIKQYIIFIYTLTFKCKLWTHKCIEGLHCVVFMYAKVQVTWL